MLQVFCLCQVFTVPMRNWNFFISAVVFPIPPGFYSTYEELKRGFCIEATTVVIGFYSTYEELKRSLPHSAIITASRFYSTYEELKHIVLDQNTELFVAFLQYLWGIETHARGRRKDKKTRFLQYLWGIETLFQLIFSVWFPVFLQYLWGNVMCLFLPHLVR